MDSDSENLLVIDETRRPETPVSDSSERDKTNSSRDKANKENREILQTCISTPASTSSISSNLFNAKEKEHGSAKSESHKSNKSKLNQQTEKRDDAEKKKYAFRLTHLEDFETKLLRVTALPHQFYNMRFYLAKEDFLVSELPTTYPETELFPNLTFLQLMNWPGVFIKIKLDHLVVASRLEPNFERDIVFGSKNDINIDTTLNITETRHVKVKAEQEPTPTISKQLFETYTLAMADAAESCKVTEPKLHEIDCSFKKMVANMATVKTPLIETKTRHSRFLNKHKYMRLFDNNTQYKKKSGYLKVMLREVINPECRFHIEGCSIGDENPETWLEKIDSYFKDIFSEKGKTNDAVRVMFEKCITLRCFSCNRNFDGPTALKEHIQKKHFVNKPWQCVKCKQCWSQFELVQMEWKHECEESI